MAWTYADNYNLVPNLYVRSHFDNEGVLSHYQIYPCIGYVLYSPTNDSYVYDDNGEIVYDENGNPVTEPYYSWGGATEMPDYNWTTNPNQWQAVPYEEGMTVWGGVRPPEEDI